MKKLADKLFKSEVLISSDFYKDLTSKGVILHSSQTKDEDLDNAYFKFIKSRVKNEFIDLYLENDDLKRKFARKFKRSSVVYELDKNILIEGRCNGKVCAVLYMKDSIQLDENTKLDCGLNGFLAKEVCRDNYFLGISAIFKEIEIDKKEFLNLTLKIDLTHIDSGKRKRLDNGYSKKPRNSSSYYYFILLNKYIIARNFDKKQYALLNSFNNKSTFCSNSHFELIDLILNMGKYPYLVERLYTFKSLFPFIYKTVENSMREGPINFLLSLKEPDFLSFVLKNIYFNFDFTKKHIEFIKTLTSNGIRAIIKSNGMVDKGLYFFLFELSKLTKEQLPKNYFELCMLSEIINCRIKIPNNLSSFCKPLYEKALYNLKNNIHENHVAFHKGKRYNQVTKKGQLCFLSAEKAAVDSVVLVKDYVRGIKNDLALISDDEASMRDKLSNVFDLLLKSKTLKSLNEEAIIYHDHINQIHLRRTEAINDYNLKNNMTGIQLGDYSFKAPLLLENNEINGIPIKQLRNENDLRFEGEFMFHCVGNYVTPTLKGNSIIFHIGNYEYEDVKNMKDKSTVEIVYRFGNRSFEVAQHQTYKNQKYQAVTKEHNEIAQKLCSMLTKKYGSHWENKKSKRNKERLFANVMPKDGRIESIISAEGFMNIYLPVNGLSTLQKLLTFTGDQVN